MLSWSTRYSRRPFPTLVLHCRSKLRKFNELRNLGEFREHARAHFEVCCVGHRRAPIERLEEENLERVELGGGDALRRRPVAVGVHAVVVKLGGKEVRDEREAADGVLAERQGGGHALKIVQGEHRARGTEALAAREVRNVGGGVSERGGGEGRGAGGARSVRRGLCGGARERRAARSEEHVLLGGGHARARRAAGSGALFGPEARAESQAALLARRKVPEVVTETYSARGERAASTVCGDARWGSRKAWNSHGETVSFHPRIRSASASSATSSGSTMRKQLAQKAVLIL